MGGLVVIPNYPAPKYEFEMSKLEDGVNGTSSSLFLHFEVKIHG